uniref:Uncharacterized protein n=1 Tax=Arundo donax TaxID=35708 RepID=A0A0A9DK48_ARUDO
MHRGLVHLNRRRPGGDQERLGRVRDRLRPPQLRHHHPARPGLVPVQRHRHRQRGLRRRQRRPGGGLQHLQQRLRHPHQDQRRPRRLHPERHRRQRAPEQRPQRGPRRRRRRRPPRRAVQPARRAKGGRRENQERVGRGRAAARVAGGDPERAIHADMPLQREALRVEARRGVEVQGRPWRRARGAAVAVRGARQQLCVLRWVLQLVVPSWVSYGLLLRSSVLVFSFGFSFICVFEIHVCLCFT